MATAPANQILVKQKLEAFDHLQTRFEECFQFVQNVHGQRRFSSFSVAEIVYYLHALWICECKTCLLSILKTVKAYEGRLSLQLLRLWQEEEDTASVIAFLQLKLDTMPFADLTRQLHEAQLTHKDDGLAQRLAHGRLILLNRGMNLMQALDAVFKLTEEELFTQVRVACEHLGHLPSQIEQQLKEMDTPVYSYVPHPALAQRNMIVMNKLGVNVSLKPADLPGQRSWRVLSSTPKPPEKPFAEHVVHSYQQLIAPIYNNPLGKRFVDRPERSETGKIL